jgi:hypothetical protein
MRQRSLAGIFLTTLAIAVTVTFFVFIRPAVGVKPIVTFSLTGYALTNRVIYTEIDGDKLAGQKTPMVRLSTSHPRDGVPFQKHTSALLASVRIRNAGRYPIVYQSQSAVPYYDCRLVVSNVTTLCTYFRFSGGAVVLEPGKTVDFSVWLPPNVHAWQVGFGCGRAAWRRAFMLRHVGVLSHLPGFLLERIPPPSDDWNDHEVWSDLFTVPDPRGSALVD